MKICYISPFVKTLSYLALFSKLKNKRIKSWRYKKELLTRKSSFLLENIIVFLKESDFFHVISIHDIF